MRIIPIHILKVLLENLLVLMASLTFINPGSDDQNSTFGITSLPVAPLLYFMNNIPATR